MEIRIGGGKSYPGAWAFRYNQAEPLALAEISSVFESRNLVHATPEQRVLL
jgi:hypothetical protein